MLSQARRRWVSVHKWIGLTVGILFLFEAVTGCILVYQHELSDMLDRPLSSRTGAEPISISADDALAAATRIDPTGKPTMIGMPASNPDHAYRIIQASSTGSRPHEIWVDPATGQTTTRHGRPVQAVLDFIWSLHKRLAIPLVGDLLIAVSGLILVVSTVSGIVLWWPRPGKWRQAFAVKRGAALPRLTFDVHKLIGLCLTIMCLLWGISGTYMIQPSWITGWLPRAMQPQNERAIATMMKRGKPASDRSGTNMSPQRVADLAVTGMAGGEAIFLFPPRTPGDCVWRVRVARGDDLVRYVGSATVAVDACHRTIAGRVDECGDMASRVFYWLRPLHSGEAFGAIGKFIVIWAGIGFFLMGASGLLLWWLRRKARRKTRNRRPA